MCPTAMTVLGCSQERSLKSCKPGECFGAHSDCFTKHPTEMALAHTEIVCNRIYMRAGEPIGRVESES